MVFDKLVLNFYGLCHRSRCWWSVGHRPQNHFSISMGCDTQPILSNYDCLFVACVPQVTELETYVGTIFSPTTTDVFRAFYLLLTPTIQWHLNTIAPYCWWKHTVFRQWVSARLE